MPTRHSIKVHVPIPPEISPAHVVATLQTFEPLLDNHGYIVEYRPKSGPISCKDEAVIKGDPFFQHDWHDLGSRCTSPDAATDSRWWLCDVWEDVYWVPFIVPYFSRLKRYLAVGCKTESGIRFRQSVSGGVITRGTFTVISRETGRPYSPFPRERAPGVDGDVWDADTEKGSIASNERGGENEGGESLRDAIEKGPRDWDPQDDTDAETEPVWDIVCACEIEMPLILIVSQILRRDANRALCEHLCKSVIDETAMEFSYSPVYDSDLPSS
ncbi:hypothetical protein E0Z10_g4469 [Xylaria hypoxylon]|uniref:DUF7053 domain-containing protein n=1 Tax=Xylaria hypoxylon TaxID=37992 RepID=A0A4Z0YK98_9PEZI|nr:hypothetical protein E0Z10_g4469 [Xylaria hypoxylon]